MSTTSKRLDKQATKVKHDLHEMDGTVRDAAQQKINQMGETASEYFEQGRHKVYGIACASEQFIRERPLTSIVMAAGVGWLLGRFWKRR